MGNNIIAVILMLFTIAVLIMIWHRHKLIANANACDNIKLSPEAKERMIKKTRQMYEANDDREQKTTADIFNLIKELERIQGNKITIINDTLSLNYTNSNPPVIVLIKIPDGTNCDDAYYFIEEYVNKQKHIMLSRFNYNELEKINRKFEAIRKMNETIEQYDNTPKS